VSAETTASAVAEALFARAARVRLLGFDVDGVLTTGGIYRGDTEDLRRFDSRDGVGIKLLQKAGIVVAVISGKSCQAVTNRCAELGIVDVHQGSIDKVSAMKALLAKYELEPAQAGFVGDDLPDIPLLLHTGLGLAVADACEEVRHAARLVLESPGGRGAAREAAELILRAQGRWSEFVEGFRRQTLE
jgi:3-deoxy-D-manno-octulosonate 8-phosphate phosphatase (KDO 8-P phosphatase)